MNNINLGNDFRLFARDKGVSMSTFDDVRKSVNNSLTPNILETRKDFCASVDVFSRLLADRIIFFGNEFNTETCNTVTAELMYLNSLDHSDINIYIMSGGGEVCGGLQIIDTMNLIQCDVSTTCFGMAASMGAVLLSSGTKGKRHALTHSRVMIHQVSGGFQGDFTSMQTSLEQSKRYRDDVYRQLAKNMGKTFEEVELLCDRDKWYIGQEAVEVGLVDDILTD